MQIFLPNPSQACPRGWSFCSPFHTRSSPLRLPLMQDTDPVSVSLGPHLLSLNGTLLPTFKSVWLGNPCEPLWLYSSPSKSDFTFFPHFWHQGFLFSFFQAWFTFKIYIFSSISITRSRRKRCSLSSPFTTYSYIWWSLIFYCIVTSGDPIYFPSPPLALGPFSKSSSYVWALMSPSFPSPCCIFHSQAPL